MATTRSGAGADNDSVYAGDGNDTVRPARPATITSPARDGNDPLYGGDRRATRSTAKPAPTGSAAAPATTSSTAATTADCLYGEAGDDTLHGEDGNDYVYGGDGKDHALRKRRRRPALRRQRRRPPRTAAPAWTASTAETANDTLVSLDAAATDILFGQNDFDSFWTDDSDTDQRRQRRTKPPTNFHRIDRFDNGADRTLDGDRHRRSDRRPVNYKDFADRPLFAAAGPSEDDIDQGGWATAG